MKQLVILCIFFLVLLEVNTTRASLPKTKLNVVEAIHRPANFDDKGFWKKRIEWKYNLVKEWHQETVFFPLWRKIWTPIEISEWVPLPKQSPWSPHEQKVEIVT